VSSRLNCRSICSIAALIPANLVSGSSRVDLRNLACFPVEFCGNRSHHLVPGVGPKGNSTEQNVTLPQLWLNSHGCPGFLLYRAEERPISRLGFFAFVAPLLTPDHYPKLAYVHPSQRRRQPFDGLYPHSASGLWGFLYHQVVH